MPAYISSLLIGGPYNGQLPKDSPSRRRIFVCQPQSKADETACAKKFCRSWSGARIGGRQPMKMFGCCSVSTRLRGRAANFDSGIRAALERVLVSPDFLFRIEADPVNAAPGAIYRISDVELASRLSFFLWSSSPDDELLNLAIAGKLRDANILDQQVRRMLADPRARTALVENFFEQWLKPEMFSCLLRMPTSIFRGSMTTCGWPLRKRWISSLMLN